MKLAISLGRQYLPAEVLHASLSRPTTSPCREAMASSVRMERLTSSRAMGTSASPASVSWMCRPARLNSSPPSRFSSERICMLTAGWDICKRRPASEKLPVSAAARKI